jgi:glucan biosynthesis protein C
MNRTDRLHFLDGLRIAALGLLILYHVGMYYVRWDWHVKSPFASAALEPLMQLSSPWRMSLLFLVSGAVSSLLLARAGTTGAWLRGRLRRLGLPLLAGILVIVPPQSYFEVRQQAGYAGSYLDFLPLYLSGHRGFCDAQGDCLLVPTWNHLWFLPYLMVYTLALWAALRLRPGVLDAAAARLARRLGPLTLLLLPWALLAALRLALRPWFGITHALVDDPLAHAQYLPAFVLGALWARTPGAWRAVAQLRWPALVLGLAGWALALAAEPATPATLLRAGFALQQWCGVLAAVGFAVRHLDHDGPWRRRLSEAVFPVYVLHQTLIITIAMALRPLALPPALEGPLLLAATIAAAAMLVAAIGRADVLRPWLGFAPASTDSADRHLASSLPGRAGAEAQHGVQRAPAHRGGQQRHHADPAPDADGAGECQGDQGQAQHDAKNAVETAHVALHGSLLRGLLGNIADALQCGYAWLARR